MATSTGQFDLNLLRVFLAVYETRSVSRAAETLHVTQPSVSYNLGRLRREIGDPLFTRSGRMMLPTPRADGLAERFTLMVDQVDEAIGSGRTFDPPTSTRRFRLALTDIGELSFLPRIVDQMRRSAPSATLDIVPMNVDLLDEWLERGHVDAGISSVPMDHRHQQEVLLRDHYVCISPPASATPEEGETIGATELSQLSFAALHPSSGHSQADEHLAELGIQRNIVLRVNGFAALPQLVEAAGLAAIVPGRIAEVFRARWDIAVRELPVTIPAFQVTLSSRRRRSSAPAEAWFTDLVATAARGVFTGDD